MFKIINWDPAFHNFTILCDNPFWVYNLTNKEKKEEEKIQK
jgi:hypothetical protein